MSGIENNSRSIHFGPTKKLVCLPVPFRAKLPRLRCASLRMTRFVVFCGCSTNTNLSCPCGKPICASYYSSPKAIPSRHTQHATRHTQHSTLHAHKIVTSIFLLFGIFSLKYDIIRGFPVVQWKRFPYKEKYCNKNVIIFKKGIAICKRVCYNTVTYIRKKGVRAYEEEICVRIAGQC